MPRRRTLGKLSSAAIESIRATAMLASPIALGESTGSAPMTATQTLPATAITAAMTRSRHERRRRPLGLRGTELAADGGEDAAEQEPGAADGLARRLREQRGLEEHRKSTPSAPAAGTATANRRRWAANDGVLMARRYQQHCQRRRQKTPIRAARVLTHPFG